MLLSQQKDAHALVDLLGSFMDAIHHELVRNRDIVLEYVGLLDFRSCQLDEGLSVEGEGLVGSTVNQKIFCVLFDRSG